MAEMFIFLLTITVERFIPAFLGVVTSEQLWNNLSPTKIDALGANFF